MGIIPSRMENRPETVEELNKLTGAAIGQATGALGALWDGLVMSLIEQGVVDPRSLFVNIWKAHKSLQPSLQGPLSRSIVRETMRGLLPLTKYGSEENAPPGYQNMLRTLADVDKDSRAA